MSNPTGFVAIPPNPGGSLPPPQILGRDSLVERCWRHLEQQSIALFSPRRVGKTSVLRLLEHRAPPGWHVRFHDLERLDSGQAFAQFLYSDALDLLSGRNKALARAKAFLQRVSGSIELSNVELTLAGDEWRRGIGVEPRTAVTDSIMAHSEGHPFLIQHLVESLRGKHEPNEGDVAESLARLLSPPSVLDLGHYASRLTKYYGEREAPALAILDALARASKGMALDALLEQLSMDRTTAVPVIQALRDDDYLTQRGRHLRFSLDFVRRYWCDDRML